MSRPLPFDAFLDALRGRGFAVGLHEHMALGRLLSQWDGIDRAALGAAIAALIGRSEIEVAEARRLFDELYLPPLPAQIAPTPDDAGAVPTTSSWWSGPVAAVAAVGLLLVIASFAGYYFVPARSAPPATSSSTAPDPQPPAEIQPGDAIQPQPPTPPPLPDPMPRVVEGAVWQTGAALFLIGLAGAWGLERRRAYQGWLSESWRRALGSLPGPYRIDMRVRDLQTRLPRADVEDAAGILGRIYRTDERTRELDAAESVRLTLRRGLLPSLSYRRVRTARPIVVLQDVGLDMHAWRAKVERLLFDLRRQGVVLERWYFDGDPRRVAERPYGATRPLPDVLVQRTDFPLLVISAGGGLAALGDDDRWLQTLQRCARRAWLTPVSDARLWPALLASTTIAAWPMSRDGLTSAARALAGQEPAESVRASVIAEGHVLLDDIERLERLASLVPHPTPEFLERLRQEFAPDIPDAAVVHVTAAAGAGNMREIRLPDAEVARLAAAVRAETPRLEAEVRREILRHLADAEPPEGSAAHLRWQLARARQQEQLAALGDGDGVAARATIDALRQGPLWEEVQQVASGPNDKRSAATSRPPNTPPAIGAAPRPRVRPGARELALATFAAATVVVIALQAGAFPAVRLAPLENAYELRLAGDSPLAIELRTAAPEQEQPDVVDLYRNGILYRGNMARAAAADVTRIDLPVDATGGTYQVQAARTDGNVARSNPLWVPDGQSVVVLIDAHPWARVTATGLSGQSTIIASEATPLRVALQPGAYRLDFENGGVTAPLQQQITVTPDNPAQRFIFDMPGFDPAAAAGAAGPAQ